MKGKTHFRTESPVKVKIAAGIIAALREGLTLMRVGSKFEFYVPPHLAYAEKGAGTIEPNETIVLTVRLLSLERHDEL